MVLDFLKDEKVFVPVFLLKNFMLNCFSLCNLPDMILFHWMAEFRRFFPLIYFFWTFFSSLCYCQYELLYVLFWYFSILISFNVLVHQVNVTEVDVSAEIELWQRSISHDRSKLNIYIFDVYVYIYNITCFVFVKSCFIILVTDIFIYWNIDT